MGFNVVGLWLHDLHRQLRSAPRQMMNAAVIAEGDLVS